MKFRLHFAVPSEAAYTWRHFLNVANLNDINSRIAKTRRRDKCDSLLFVKALRLEIRVTLPSSKTKEKGCVSMTSVFDVDRAPRHLEHRPIFQIPSIGLYGIGSILIHCMFANLT